MAQPPSSTDPEAPRPLPRRAAPRSPSSARANRPRFQALDAVWAILLAFASLVFSARLGDLTEHRYGGSLAAAGTVAALYLLGWRARDRAAGFSAGLLAALSPQFLHLAAYSPQSAPFAMLTIGALFAFVAGSSLAALALAAGAAMIRPDGALLGLLLLGIALVQHRKRTLYGALVFFIPIAAYEISRSLLGFRHPRLPVLGLHGGVWHWLWTPASALLVWLLLPFCAELSEPLRRTRWAPVILWTAILLVSVSVQSVTSATGMVLPIMPLLFALAGGGLSRLLPTLAGEFPSPAIRYALATLAVAALIGLHLRLEPIAPQTVLSNSAVTEPRSH